MPRLSKIDWLDEGFKILGEFAQDKLKIAYLCERLCVTRGSFYHHFESIDSYISELLKEWAEQNTLELIRASDDEDTEPEKRMETLTRLIISRNHAVEAAIRSWGFYNKIVSEYLLQVDKKRIKHLQKIFKGMGLSSKEALTMGKLEYATLIGIQQMSPRIKAKEMTKLYQFRKALFAGTKIIS